MAKTNKKPHHLDKVIVHNMLERVKSKLNQGRLILFLIGGLSIVFFLVMLFSEQDTTDEYLAILLVQGAYAISFVTLGLFSHKYPKPVMIAGLAIYIGVIFLGMLADPSSLLKGFIMKAIVIGGLIKGYMAAKEAEELKVKLREIEDGFDD